MLPAWSRHARKCVWIRAVWVITLKQFIKTAVNYALLQTVGRREFSYVFVLAHMRSGSTLLSHILSSHPDFTGAGEMNITYKTPADLPKLIAGTCQFLHTPFLRGRYIVDQLNHDCYVTPEVIAALTRAVILIRKPEATLKSLIALFKHDEAEALAYYTSRLNTLAEYGRLLGDRAMFIDYDDLVEHSDETLAALTDFFGVYTPFSADYTLKRTTGVVGDPTDNIKSGRIQRTRGHIVPLSDAVLETATKVYDNWRNRSSSRLL